MITVCTGKLHRVTVTEANLDYQGSITLDPVLMEAAGIAPYQLVHVNGYSDGTHWETYALEGQAGSGVVCLNGPPARLFRQGDEVVVCAYELVKRELASYLTHRLVRVREGNVLHSVELHGLKRAG